jgi:hypothetical protein
VAGDFFKVEAGDVLKAIADLSEKDAPFVTAYALTKTAQDIAAAEKASMSDVFDRPTNFTLNSLAVKTASKTDLNAIVYFKDGFGSVPAFRYLLPEVEGGDRKHKAHELRLIRAGLMRSNEFAVPGAGVTLDQYGNIPGGTIERILSQVAAAEQFSGYQANATKKSLKAKRRKDIGRYFVLRPDGFGISARAAAPGIYWRAGVRDIVPVILFVRAPRYRKRFPFHETAQRVFDERLLLRAREAWQTYVVPKLKKA